jgi:glycine hydroxymethyltransferase
LLVVNAANDDRNWAWLNAVIEGKINIDPRSPNGQAFGRGVNLLNLQDPNSAIDMRVDLALQGPNSRNILLDFELSPKDRKALKRLKRFRLRSIKLDDFDVIVSRTGYTGERYSYELFIHPDHAAVCWNKILELGEKHGIRPCGLASRDSLRTESGLPLYGQELSGPLSLSPADSGFRTFVKTYKPWFIGRDAFLELEKKRKREIARFRFPQKGTRPAHQGDPIIGKKGKLIGHVTSCSIDKYGTLTGQAHISKKYSKAGSELQIYQGQAGKKINEINSDANKAIVLSRFPH